MNLTLLNAFFADVTDRYRVISIKEKSQLANSPKGQLISKAIYGLLTSPKKRTDEFVLFAFLLFTANKSNSFVHFGENLQRTNLLFGFI